MAGRGGGGGAQPVCWLLCTLVLVLSLHATPAKAGFCTSYYSSTCGDCPTNHNDCPSGYSFSGDEACGAGNLQCRLRCSKQYCCAGFTGTNCDVRKSE